MSKAKTAARLAMAYAQVVFPDDAVGMSKHTIDSVTHISDCSTGSHKYIPADVLNRHLGLPQNAGVFGYVRFDDGSYILQTCSHGLAVWDGGDAVPELIRPIEATPAGRITTP